MLYELNEKKGKIGIGNKYSRTTANKISIKEKTIENLISNSPQTIFPNEEILVLGQSISGEKMADVLALDTLGNLIIIEIKRHKSSRKTIGQLLEYASKYKTTNYELLAKMAQNYEGWDYREKDLYEAFLDFADQEEGEFPKSELGDNQRIFIIAPEADSRLKNIIAWLKVYDVPIEFVSFNFYIDKDSEQKMLQIDEVSSTPDSLTDEAEWQGHWIFNTNEKHQKGAYKEMFERDVAAIYGYDSGPKNLEGSNKGDIVFAYVNKQGIRALGEVVDGQVKKGEGIFLGEDGNQKPDEYHLKVNWRIILERENAFKNSEAAQMGYNLPVRNVFAKLRKGHIANKIENEIKNRGQ